MTKRITCVGLALVLILSCFVCPDLIQVAWSASMLHSASRDVQNDGVGNPLNYGERNTSATDSVSQMRATNREMGVQEIKYAIYKEVDEHWDLIKVRLGISEREKVYAFFLGLATRETTLGINGEGADFETGEGSSFGTNSAQAYGPFQTAVTAYKNNNGFDTEYDVPEMTQYDLTESNFYDAIISLHMGIRKIIHFVNLAITEENMSGTDVLRNALKGFNTGHATAGDASYYTGYSDEIIALAHWYYSEGHLYDDEYTWTNDTRASSYRTNSWSWLSSASPSLATVSTTVKSESMTVNPDADVSSIGLGDADMDGEVNSSDAVIVLQDYSRAIVGKDSILTMSIADVNKDSSIDSDDAVIILQYYAELIVRPTLGSMEKYLGYI